MRKVVVIPSGIDLEVLYRNNCVRQNRTKIRLKDKIFYFLSRVVTHEGNIHLHQKENGYRTISMKIIDELFGPRDSRHILKILTNAIDPIIESNNSYQVGKKSKGYRLTEKYRTGLIEYRTLTEELSQKLNQFSKNDPSLPDYGFLKDQFNQNQLSFSKDFELYVLKLGISLLRVSTKDYQKNLIYNKIGRLLLYQENLSSGNLHISHSNTNHRFYSIVTSCPKYIRNLLCVDGSSLMEIDLSACQAYLLAVLLKSIDQVVSSGNILINTGNLENCNTGNTTCFHNYLINSNNKLINNIYPFMLRTFSKFPEKFKDSIRRYHSSPFDADFYQWVADQSKDLISRSDVKKTFMYFLFDDQPFHRYHNKTIQEIGKLFPGIIQLIELIHNKSDKSDFARFLQLIESHLLINIIIKEFHELTPDAPIYTIHDAVLTTPEFASLLKSHMEKRLVEMTSLYPLLKIKSPAPLEIVLEDSINEAWKEIKRINTKPKYERCKHTIFSSNIERGKKFIEEKSSNLMNLDGLNNHF